MEFCGRFYVDVPNGQPIHLWDIADTHIYSANCNEKRIKEDVAKIAEDPNSLVVLGGDLIDAISPGDKRFSAREIDKNVTVQDLGSFGKNSYRHVVELLKPIRHKIIGSCVGNHDMTLMNRTEQDDLHAWFCVEMGGIVNFGYQAMFDLILVEGNRKSGVCYTGRRRSTKKSNHSSSFRIMVTHGAGAAQSMGGRVNRIVKYLQDFDCDLVMMGHIHGQQAVRVPSIGANSDCTKPTERVRVGFSTGSYLTTYGKGQTGYGEMRGFSPTVIGARCATLDMETREIRVEI